MVLAGNYSRTISKLHGHRILTDMKIHFFCKSDANASSTRYRVYFTAQALNRLGVETAIYEPPFSSYGSAAILGRMISRTRYALTLLQIPRTDIIYLQRTVYNSYFAFFIVVAKVIFRKKIVLDFCDPLFLIQELRPRIELMMRYVDAVIVADKFAQDYSASHVGKVFLMPMALPFWISDQKRRVNFIKKEVPVIGWIGGGKYHIDNLRLLAPAFRILLKKGIRFKFLLVGSDKEGVLQNLFTIPGLSVECVGDVDWSDPSASYSFIAKFDVGVVPSTDSEWHRVKTFLKPIEMMGLGVITVMSKVGVSANLIQDGVNGFLTGNKPEEWASVLEHVLALPSEHLQMVSDEGVASIRKNRSLEDRARALRIFLENL